MRYVRRFTSILLLVCPGFRAVTKAHGLKCSYAKNFMSARGLLLLLFCWRCNATFCRAA